MTDQVSLNPRRLEAALTVLRREQAAYLPTKRESNLYRAFNISAYSMVAVAVLLVIVSSTLANMAGDIGLLLAIVDVILAIITSLLGIGTLVLFILNWGLVHKLYRHAQLRRRLKLAYYFAPAFRAQRKATPVQNAVTMCVTVLGIGWSIVGFVGVVVLLIVMLVEWHRQEWQFYIWLFSFMTLLGIGLGLASLHFMRRGKQRLEIVLRVQQNLEQQAAAPTHGSDITLSTDDYDAIASLEREHIIRDRASSIVSGRKECKASSYLCQTSRQMHEAKSNLSPELLLKVEQEIAALLTNPSPDSAVDDPVTGNRMIPVAGTSLKIQYDVDQNRNLVRLHDLRGTVA